MTPFWETRVPSAVMNENCARVFFNAARVSQIKGNLSMIPLTKFDVNEMAHMKV